jgi:hypothetical protein
MPTRREILMVAGKMALACAFSGTGIGSDVHPPSTPRRPSKSKHHLTATDIKILDEIERGAFRFFWEQADPQTGLVKDNSRPDGDDVPSFASIAAIGFGLTALCIAQRRGFASQEELAQRAATTLRFLLEQTPQEHGFFYHFLDVRTGARFAECELSSIDTALLLAGVLTCRQHFTNPEVVKPATRLYERIDWQWMLAGGDTLSHGWKPESGFLQPRWDEYSEAMMLYLLAMGSPTHPVPARCWRAWRRPTVEYYGIRYISPRAPIFVHQFSHAWIDFRNSRDDYADYFENSMLATRAHKSFCMSLRNRFPDYGEDLWGITASDSANGYTVWGGPPAMGPVDGSIVPAAAAGSLPFCPAECLRVLHRIRQRFGEKVWKRYGFVDAFNPLNGWTSSKVIGIDVGITMLMAENLRTGFVWETFMNNAEIVAAMSAAGFRVKAGSSHVFR